MKSAIDCGLTIFECEPEQTMRESGLPFDDIKNLVANLPALDADARKHTFGQLQEDGLDTQDKMQEICEWYSEWSGRSPAVHRGVVTLFAGTHALDNALTDGAAGAKLLEQVTDISAGSAVLNRLCHQHDLGLKVFDLALQLPVADITVEAALDERSCAGTIAFGMEAIAGGADLLCIAALEGKVTVSSLTILCALNELDEAVVSKTYKIPDGNIASALKQVEGHQNNPLEILRRLGGRETAALCGGILAARSQHIPVVLDSVSVLAAASILYALNPDAVSHCLFAQRRGDMLDEVITKIDMKCVFDAPLSDNTASGLAIAGGMVKSACLNLQGKA